MHRGLSNRRGVGSVATACFTALAWAGAALAADQPAPKTTPRPPGYLCIQVSDKTQFYVHYNGPELRIATSAAGLASAEPIELRGGGTFSQQITLPVPADELPPGITAFKAQFCHNNGLMTSTFFAFCKNDEQKVEWQCIAEIHQMAKDSAETAPLVTLPNFKKLPLIIRGKDTPERVRAGVRFKVGDEPKEVMAEMRKAGAYVPVRVIILDENGVQKATKSGRIADFGFS